MSKYVLLVVFFLNFVSVSAASALESDCDNAVTQTGMNECAGKEMGAAQKELDSVLEKIEELYQEDNVFLKTLTEAQTRWKELLEADILMAFPPPHTQLQYGSVLPMCLHRIRESLIEARIAYLQQWIDGTPEGDVCVGSLRTR